MTTQQGCNFSRLDKCQKLKLVFHAVQLMKGSFQPANRSEPTNSVIKVKNCSFHNTLHSHFVVAKLRVYAGDAI